MFSTLEIEAPFPPSLFASAQPGVRGARELFVVPGVSVVDLVRVGSVSEALCCVLRDYLEHAEACLRLRRGVHQQALVDELHRVQRHTAGVRLGASDCTVSIVNEPAKTPSRSNRSRSDSVSSRIAPVHRRAHSEVTRWRVAPTSRRRVERGAEVIDQDARLEHARAGGDELDRKRQTVHAATNLVRRTDVLVTPRNVRPHGLDTLDE